MVRASGPGARRGTEGGSPLRTTADRYELVVLVGRGGMGRSGGRDRVIGRRVAVRLLPDHQHGLAADLFFREARTAGGLHHRGVVTVHDLGRDPWTHAPTTRWHSPPGATGRAGAWHGSAGPR